MEPGQDWWTFDTCHMAVSDVQVSMRAAAVKTKERVSSVWDMDAPRMTVSLHIVSIIRKFGT